MPAVPDTWVIVGGGRCGLQLARAIAAAGEPLAAVVCRSRRSRDRVRRLLPGVAATSVGAELPAAGALLVAVPDDAIRECAGELARLAPATVKVALHTSGLHSRSALAALSERGIATGSFHPLLTFPAAAGPLVPLAGALAAVEGDAAAVRTGLRLARRLGMSGRRVAAADKARYHAAATIAANLTHVLVAEARSLFEGAGFAHRDAARALAPLVRAAAVEALAARRMERLSGPVARGDGATVRAHLEVLDAPLAAAYRAVARLALARIAAATPAPAAKSAADSVVRALTEPFRCGSVPADERD